MRWAQRPADSEDYDNHRAARSRLHPRLRPRLAFALALLLAIERFRSPVEVGRKLDDLDFRCALPLNGGITLALNSRPGRPQKICALSSFTMGRRAL